MFLIRKNWLPHCCPSTCGEIELYDRDKLVAHWPLVTLESVNEGGVFSRLSDYFHHKA